MKTKEQSDLRHLPFRAPGIPIKLSEKSGPPEWVQVIRTGKYRHPEYGVFLILEETLLSFKKNFDDNVLGIDINLDYAHNSHLEAAAWIRELEIREAGPNAQLWARVEWTPIGEQKVASKEFRYLSADFEYNYQDNESGKKFGPVLKGAGLTNRPFVKRMSPTVELSEFKEGENEMNELEQAKTQILKLSQDLEAAQADKKKLEDGLAGKSPEELVARIQELEALVAELKGQVELKDKEVACSAEQKALAEKKGKFDVLLSTGKAVEAQREAFMAGDMAKFAELAAPLNLEGQGSGKKPDVDATVSSAEEQIHKLAEDMVKAGKAKNISEAQSKVLHDPAHAALRTAYENKFHSKS